MEESRQLNMVYSVTSACVSCYIISVCHFC